jgi:hypothetical protein
MTIGLMSTNYTHLSTIGPQPYRVYAIGSLHQHHISGDFLQKMSKFGKLFTVTTFGESHCKGVGVIVDGCPPGLELSESDIQPQLTRRRPGQSNLTTPVSLINLER